MTRPIAPTLTEALAFWLKLGFVSFGGPAGQIAMMHHELVEKRRWISERRFLHALNYCMLLPGPEAQQLATYLGWLLHRTAGGIAAGALFILPSLVLLTLLAWVYVSFGQTPWLSGVFYGIKPAVTAIVVHAAWRIGSRTLHNAMLWMIAGLAFIALFVFNAPFPAIIGCTALIGALGGRFMPAQFSLGHAHKDSPASGSPPALIDDDTPPPPHARFRRTRLVMILATGLLLWVLPMALLTQLFGWQGTLTQMGWFFTKAALLTFGGAYAVLPYVFQGAVTHYGWLSATQMIDGLALGETTPGPLIMVVAFVAFVGGWNHALPATEARFAAGALAALTVTWFTFLPSFLFILAGGPLVESTRKALKFTAPLTAITAAIVGVIANLALFFGYHVVWPEGAAGAADPVAAAIAAGAALALFRFRAGIVPVMTGAALIGLALHLFAPSGW